MYTLMSHTNDTSTCPLCHKSNSCDVNNSAGCWCMNTNMPEALLDKVPTQFKELRCICNDCIDKYHQQQSLIANTEQQG